MRLIPALAVGLLLASSASAAVKTSEVEYRHGDTVLQGFMAWDDSVQGSRPGVLIVHQWMGLTDYERMRAEQLASLGYVAFAVDVYGKGVRPADTGEAGELAGTYKKDRALLRARVAAGLEALRASERVDPKRIAAIGYCFGGTAVLELARSGADVAGVVSFHGGLDSLEPGGRPERQGQGAGPARRRRPVRAGGGHRRVPEGAARREGGLADGLLLRRGPRFHPEGGRQRPEPGARPTTSGPTAAPGRRCGRSSTSSSGVEPARAPRPCRHHGGRAARDGLVPRPRGRDGHATVGFPGGAGVSPAPRLLRAPASFSRP